MIAAQTTTASFFRQLQLQRIDFDGERFLTEVDARFGSEALLAEVRWRLEVLHELANQRGMEAEFEVLRDRLTQIFVSGGSEEDVVARVRAITEIETRDGQRLDLRRFLVAERRLYSEPEYRQALDKKIANTQLHVTNLSVCYPEKLARLTHLSKMLTGLAERIREPAQRTRTLKVIEDRIRDTEPFQTYEGLKERFLRDWLARFASVSEQELAGLGPEELQRLVQEHQRHQSTQLVQAGVRPLDTDVAEHLGIHDTLEGLFREEEFWNRANAAVRRGFHQWVLLIVQAVGMPNGLRYAFFQSEALPDCYLLAGLGLPRLAAKADEPIRLVPYLKPFTRKAGYLFEIRRRTIGEREAYYHELFHYTLPFLFGFDHVPALAVPRALREFFNSRY